MRKPYALIEKGDGGGGCVEGGPSIGVSGTTTITCGGGSGG
jgi:hypothetical protein